MKLSLLLPALALTANASVLTKRQKSQLEYDQESTSFQSSGLCRAYHSTDRSLHDKGLSTCSTMCGDLVKQAVEEGKTNSLTCVSGGVGIPLITDPDGNQFTMGACVCDVPIIDQIAEDVLLALPAIAAIGCEILFSSFDLVLKIGLLAIPGAGEAMDVGMQAGLKAAKTLMQNGKRASSFAQWFANPCGSNKYTDMVDDIFNPLSSVSDDVMEGLGCPGGTCPEAKESPTVSVPPFSNPTPEPTTAPVSTEAVPAPEPTTTEPAPVESSPAPAPVESSSSELIPLPSSVSGTAPPFSTGTGVPVIFSNSTNQTANFSAPVPAIVRRTPVRLY